jgi:predicted transcriptional regulator
MVTLSLSQAAKETGRSKTTISKALKNGVLSYVSKTDKGYEIEPSELFRVFPANPGKTNDVTSCEPPKNTKEVELLERLNQQQAETIADLRRRLDEANDERERLTIVMLEYQKQPDPLQEKEIVKAKKRWWQKEMKLV